MILARAYDDSAEDGQVFRADNTQRTKSSIINVNLSLLYKIPTVYVLFFQVMCFHEKSFKFNLKIFAALQQARPVRGPGRTEPGTDAQRAAGAWGGPFGGAGAFLAICQPRPGRLLRRPTFQRFGAPRGEPVW